MNGFVRLKLVVASMLLAGACANNDNPLEPSMSIIPDAVTISVGQNQVFTTTEKHVDITFQISSDGGDWHQFVKATGQSYDSIQLTGVQPSGNRKVYLTAKVNGDNTKTAVAAIQVVQ